MAIGVFQIAVRLDDRGFPSIASPTPIKFTGNRSIDLRITFERLNIGVVPPAYSPEPVTGYGGWWIGKYDVDDEDPAVLWKQALTVVDGPNGIMGAAFTLPDVMVNVGYSEIILTNGATVLMRAPFPIVIDRRGIAL